MSRIYALKIHDISPYSLPFALISVPKKKSLPGETGRANNYPFDRIQQLKTYDISKTQLFLIRFLAVEKRVDSAYLGIIIFV